MKLEEKIYDNTLELKEDMACVKTQFITLNGSVKKHEKKIWWIEKILYIALGIFGTIQCLINFIK